MCMVLLVLLQLLHEAELILSFCLVARISFFYILKGKVQVPAVRKIQVLVPVLDNLRTVRFLIPFFVGAGGDSTLASF